LNELENAKYDISIKEANLAKANREAKDALELLEFRN